MFTTDEHISDLHEDLVPIGGDVEDYKFEPGLFGFGVATILDEEKEQVKK